MNRQGAHCKYNYIARQPAPKLNSFDRGLWPLYMSIELLLAEQARRDAAVKIIEVIGLRDVYAYLIWRIV